MNNPIKNVIALGMAAFTAQFVLGTPTPEVTGVTMAQPSNGRLVTITYTLSAAPAVITLDVQTNYMENAEMKWASIGGEAVCNARGDVWQKVETGSHKITWSPDL